VPIGIFYVDWRFHEAVHGTLTFLKRDPRRNFMENISFLGTVLIFLHNMGIIGINRKLLDWRSRFCILSDHGEAHYGPFFKLHSVKPFVFDSGSLSLLFKTLYQSQIISKGPPYVPRLGSEL
jgi:hypothetical protein